MREQVLITQLKITKAGQVNHFQVRLPKNSIRIIGIELGCRLIKKPKTDGTATGNGNGAEAGTGNGTAEGTAGEVIPREQVFEKQMQREEIIRSLFPFKRTILIGELKLQSCEQANIFFASHFQLDENLGAGDYSQNQYWKANLFTHQIKAEEDIVIVDGDSTIIAGIFKDRLGELNKSDFEYIVNVYVWIEIQEEKTKGDKS